MSCPEELVSLKALWHAKRGTRILPGRSDFTPEDLKPWLGNIAIIAVEPQPDGHPRFRVALSGTTLDDYRGYSVTGRYLDELSRNIALAGEQYAECVTRREPVHFIHDNSSNSAIYTVMAKMLLPLGDDGVTVNRILTAIYPLSANDGPAGRMPYALAC